MLPSSISGTFAAGSFDESNGLSLGKLLATLELLKPKPPIIHMSEYLPALDKDGNRIMFTWKEKVPGDTIGTWRETGRDIIAIHPDNATQLAAVKE